MGPVRQYADEKVDGPLTLRVHPGADGNFSLYEDDGKTFNFRRGEFTRIEISWEDASRRLRLRPAPGSRMMEYEKKSIVVKIAGESATHEVTFGGKPQEIKL